eukprot:NODE_6060_length_931_cov_95.882426_g5406_i1.p1 GENE.NODE_6060_length_931_cov_95.882426_g5406_i1~~NODE_6060_length_931_cov_95.882426_g5406_i1.p1  ORF type:complete len:254 (-),score=42.87 NODE_6060_length_931_cov_95.882426_g5406_i1:168-878(-)
MIKLVVLLTLLLVVLAKKGDGCNCDLEIIIDTSCSIPAAAHSKVLRFVQELLQANFKKVGVIAYDKTVRVISDPISNDGLISNILDALPKTFWCTKDSKPGCCNTRTNEALQTALNIVEDLESKRKNTCKVIILFTDGKTFPREFKDDTKSVAKKIHQLHPDWTVITVGVGHKIDVDELKAIASGDSNDNVILKPNFNSIRGVDICPDLPTPSPDNDPPCEPDDDDGEDDDPTPQK